MIPTLERSYHSLIGWDVKDNSTDGDKFDRHFICQAEQYNCDGPAVCAFGGYTTALDIFSGGTFDGDHQLALVFSLMFLF